MRLVWDEPKRRANLVKHGFDFAEIDMPFFENAIVRPSHSGRFLALGRHRGVRIAVVFRPLGREALSLVSVRAAGRSDWRMIHGGRDQD